MTLQEDIDYWRRWAQRSKTDAWLIAIGVAYGLTLARDEHATEIAAAIEREALGKGGAE